MELRSFEPEQALGEKLLEMNREELCAFVGDLCLAVQAKHGSRTYLGGIFPENISFDGKDSVGIGPGKLEKWRGQELDYVAPELYWHGDVSPSSDVYSLGLVLWYGLSGGKLPFEGESPNAQLSRVSGKSIPAPPQVPERLGQVVAKACSFKAEDRYQNLGQLQIMLASCVDNRYLGGKTGAKAVFGKDELELSEMEKLMVDIISGEQQAPAPAEDKPSPEDAERDAFVDQMLRPAEPEPEPEPEPQMIPLHPRPEPREEKEDVRLYEPAKAKKPPVLKEEKNPVLQPIVVEDRSGAVKTSAPREQRSSPEEKKPRRRSPLAAVLVLCALLVLGAVAADVILRQQEAQRQPEIITTPEPTPTPTPMPTPTPTPEPTPVVSTYQVVQADVSWTEAQAACRNMGGHLAVITDQQELDQIAFQAQQAGLTRLWVGCHRDNGTLVYETTEAVTFDIWDHDNGEPSYWDSYDGEEENYVMLWYRDGAWTYNDSRNDPVGEFPEWYRGTIGYVCEFGN